MSWIVNSSLTFFQRFCVNILKCGPIPNHVAFIMDGNRRYASKEKLQKREGHARGFDKLAETLQWCLEIGIKEVTVYAFSIENFKRSDEEVEILMKLATEKFQKLLEEKEKLMEEGVCIRVIGTVSLLSDELKKLIAEATLLTKDNNKAILNIAFAYTTQDEIAHAMEIVVAGVKEGLLQIDDINEDLLSQCFYTNKSPDPGILVRTSGEIRLSDFLMWQVSGSSICFTQVLWPEFKIWHLLYGVFMYQRDYNNLKNYRSYEQSKEERNERIIKFLEHLENKRLAELKGYMQYEVAVN